MFLLQDSKNPECGSSHIVSAVAKSFVSFGIADHRPLTLDYIKVLLIPVPSVDEQGVKDALMIADLALAVLNKKLVMSRARLISWNRRQGVAVGAVCHRGKWEAIEASNTAMGPGFRYAPEVCYWDKFLHDSLKNNLTPLGKALSKCMSWDRESQRTANIVHRFAFSWVGLESMLPKGEKDGPGANKRIPLLIGAPSKYYSTIIYKNQALQGFSSANPNPESKKWKKTIEEMYVYRCEIFHEGGTEFTSETVDPLKGDWYAKLADFLCDRLVTLAGMACAAGVESVDEFWDSYLLKYLMSADNHWRQTKVFFGEHQINFDWASGIYPELNHV
ncbi:hypothetical protein [Pseudomonas chlororaphis]|nr:hypothetical protein [Pseudomonas chlororaphis]MBM0285020.1 hypothetical protein [Pseudomonas chlororaphis]TWR99116.1 hypothetical protein FJD36_03890 [Pseudomonas chlororaphis subsp. chlororaphis]WDG99714.1 hypothetical protein PUP54_09140 [Pseudomonas chlororaphis]WDH18720.1 hypothetical protein PUP70_11640 [Pseudomonas chlororaphis]WDH66539.1 hypothetical protein PUP71_07440 [Pseudomonas chlororaphis]